MQRRHDGLNIPIELLRSFAAIQDLGSFTRAADALRLTQPAISAQIKRLQQLVGGEVFVKSGLGISLSERGEIVSRYARRILAMNDQILSLTGANSSPKAIRIGLPNVYASSMLSGVIAACRAVGGEERLQFCCESSVDLMRSLANGFIDVAFVAAEDIRLARPIERWSERICWVSAPDFSLHSGAPIPLLSWPHGISDQKAIEALENAGLSYLIVFAAADFGSQVAALKSGLGTFVLPERIVPAELKIVREALLPPLPDLHVGVYVSLEADSRSVRTLADALIEALRPDSPAQPLADRAV